MIISGSTEALKARQEAVQQSLVVEEERLRGVISDYTEERSGLEHTLSALQSKVRIIFVFGPWITERAHRLQIVYKN